MRSERKLIAYQSVVELHQWIEDIFTGRAGYPSALKMLLNSFSTSFTMITIQGKAIGLSDVESLFRHHIGNRPQLRIEIDGCETLLESETSVVCRYRETHHDGDVMQARWSIVVIDISHGQPLWRYLHETPVKN